MLFMLLIVSSITVLTAQNTSLEIKKTDNSELKTSLSSIQKISFSDSDIVINYTSGNADYVAVNQINKNQSLIASITPAKGEKAGGNQKTEQQTASAKVDELLAAVTSQNSANNKSTLKVNAKNLLSEVDKDISQSFRNKLLRTAQRNYQEVAEALDKSIFKIEEAILKALEATPPELAADIYRRGLYITGGGALLRGLDKRLTAKIKLPVHVADDPLKSVVRGTGIALKNYDKYPFVMR